MAERKCSGAESKAYPGSELELFAEARGWKRYLTRVLEPHLCGHVLEVGAGIGGTTRFLCQARAVSAWTALEPDPRLLERLRRAASELEASRRIPVRALGGTVEDLAAARFDAVVYVDVLEHVEDDRAEVARAFERLLPGGRLIALAPAHLALYSEFDAQVGHHRRYDRRSLAALTPPSARLVALRYLDSVGLLASLANRLILHASLPSEAQIRVWDRLMVPASRVLDVLSLGTLGKSVLAVWERARA